MAMLSETLRSRWFSTCLHAGLWVLFLLVIIGLGFGGRAPQLREVVANPSVVTSPVPVAQLEQLFKPGNYPKSIVDPALSNLFATAYFVPPPTPTTPTAAPPPPPTTRKIELTYQGFYRTGDGPKYALLRLEEKLVGIPVGGMVVTNLFVVDAVLQTLTLTNTAAQSNVLTLNTQQVVEVPIK
jgi:hypothetical protein